MDGLAGAGLAAAGAAGPGVLGPAGPRVVGAPVGTAHGAEEVGPLGPGEVLDEPGVVPVGRVLGGPFRPERLPPPQCRGRPPPPPGSKGPVLQLQDRSVAGVAGPEEPSPQS